MVIGGKGRGPRGGEGDWVRSVDSPDAFDLRAVLLEVPLDTDLKSHGTGGATDTGPVQADFGDSIGRDIDQFDIAPIGLHRGADETDDFLDLL